MFKHEFGTEEWFNPTSDCCHFDFVETPCDDKDEAVEWYRNYEQEVDSERILHEQRPSKVR